MDINDEIVQEKVICTTCPMACEVTVTRRGGEVLSVSGNTCPRGKAFAISEVTNPVRTLTSSIMVDGRPLAVKTSAPIEKGKLMQCMRVIKRTTAAAPIEIGDIIIVNICETGANLIAAARRK